MFARKLKVVTRNPEPVDPGRLAAEEASLEASEATLATALAALEPRERDAMRALEECRQELAALSGSPVGEAASQALRSIPSFVTPGDAVLPERERANEARRAAIAARREAVEAEQRRLERRRGLLSQAETALAATATALESLRTQLRDLEEKAKQAAARAALASAPAAPPPAPRERRRSARTRLEVEIDLVSDSNLYTGFASDLSDGGVFVATSRLLEFGTGIDLAFTLPGGHRVEAAGIVRWHREVNDRTPEVMPGMGIELVGLAPEDRQAIQEFIRQRDPLFWA